MFVFFAFFCIAASLHCDDSLHIFVEGCGLCENLKKRVGLKRHNIATRVSVGAYKVSIPLTFFTQLWDIATDFSFALTLYGEGDEGENLILSGISYMFIR